MSVSGSFINFRRYSHSFCGGWHRSNSHRRIGICGRGIYLSRKLDEFYFYGDANNGSEGFSIEFGSRGQIRGFSFVWPNPERFQQSACLSPKQIIRCLQERRIIIVPDDAEPNYFQRIEMLARARAFTITKITSVYGDSVFGEVAGA
jgi:hypothetical protein